MRQSSLFFPLLLITVGTAWFLKSTDILPATSTLIAAAFATVGVLVLLMDGVNKHRSLPAPCWCMSEPRCICETLITICNIFTKTWVRDGIPTLNCDVMASILIG